METPLFLREFVLLCYLCLGIYDMTRTYTWRPRRQWTPLIRQLEWANYGLMVGILHQTIGWAVIPIPSISTNFGWNITTKLIGLGLMLFGLMIALDARRAMGKAFQPPGTSAVSGEEPLLVTTGIFEVTRNPNYLGYLVMFFGSQLIYGSYLICGVVPLFFLMNAWAVTEERILLSQFSVQYIAYSNRVPRWL